MNKRWFPYQEVVGWVLSLLISAALIMSAYMKLGKSKEVVEGFEKFGYPASMIVPIGSVELACVVVFLIPQTSLFGLALLTAYLGGACATHVRVGEACVPQVIFGVLLWIAMVLRYPGILRAPYAGVEPAGPPRK